MLEKITKVELENFEMQKKFIRNTKKFKEKKANKVQIKSKIDIIENDLKHFNSYKVNEEIDQLVTSIDSITEELDHLTLMNKSYISKMDNDSKTILNLMKEIEETEKENEDLKKILNLSPLDYYRLQYSNQIMEEKQDEVDIKDIELQRMGTEEKELKASIISHEYEFSNK